ECGVYDVRGGSPRPTALAAMARSLASGQAPVHPVLSTPGWWRRPSRLLHASRRTDEPSHGAAPILITGATGTLGQAFARICTMRGLDHRLLCRADLDIADQESVERALDRFQPWALINAPGWVTGNEADQGQVTCFREIADGWVMFARSCACHGVSLVTFSSDLVSDGRRDAPYVEDDAVAQLNV